MSQPRINTKDKQERPQQEFQWGNLVFTNSSCGEALEFQGTIRLLSHLQGTHHGPDTEIQTQRCRADPLHAL